jgi:pyruvate/2-oxoglutarate/acetoin dehydrogenase E1 component
MSNTDTGTQAAGTTRMSYGGAIVRSLRQSLLDDPRFLVIGNEPLGLGPPRHEFDALQEAFPDRILFPPTSEAAFAAIAAGAAMCGQRLFAHLGMVSFTYPAFSSIANEIATAHFHSGGRIQVPMLMHVVHGIQSGTGSQHSESSISMFWNLPGIEIVLPSSARDWKGLYATALRSPNPTMIFSHGSLFGVQDDVPDEDYAIPFGQAAIRRQGRHVTIVATSLTVTYALEAAERLAAEGIEAEIIDPRTLRPLDKPTILASVARTGRLVTVDEGRLSCGVGAEIAALVAEEAFAHLRAPIARVGRPDAPVSAARTQEGVARPSADKIIAAVRRIVAYR